MKKSIMLIAAITLAACSGIGGGDPVIHVNPDPNHIHADFAVWINGEQIDFTDQRYMSDPVDEEHDHGTGGQLHMYLHLHDGVGHVIHAHRPDMTIGAFFSSLGFSMDLECFTLDTGERFCPADGKRWRFLINGRERPMDPDYVIRDLDTILLSYGETLYEARQQHALLTDDACLYSRTCPERGDPPAENCVADPEIPCIAPLD